MSTTVAPPPGVAPALTPAMTPDALLVEEIEGVFEDVRIGVRFDTPKVYAYLAPPWVRVGSIVIVPPSWFNENMQTTEVVTLDPPPYPGQLKRVLAVLS